MNELYVKENDAPILSSDNTVAATINRGQEVVAEINHQRDVENASFDDKFRGFLDTWDSTYLGRSYDYLSNDAKYMFDTLDEEWAKGNTNKVMAEKLNKLGVQPKYYRQFADAKNQLHFDAIAQRVLDTQKTDRNIADTLNSYGGLWSERGISTFLTNMVDIDVVTSAGLGIVNKTNKLRNIMLNNQAKVGFGAATIHTAAAKIAYDTDPSVSAGEALFFGTVGSLIDVGQIKYYNHKRPVTDDVVDGVVNNKTSKDYQTFHSADMDRIRINKLNDAEYESYTNDFSALAKNGTITADEAAALTAGLLNKRKMNEAKAKLKAVDNGNGYLNLKGSNRKIAVATLLSMGIAVDAEGSDGLIVTAYGLGLVALLGAAGFMTAKSALKASATFDVEDAKIAISNFMSDVPAKFKSVNTGIFKAVTGKPVSKEVHDLNSFRIALFETTQPLLDETNKLKGYQGFKANNIAKNMFFNTGDGTVMSVEKNRDRMFKSWDNMILDSMGFNYKQWLKDTKNKTKYDSDEGYFIGSRNAFEQEVFRHNSGIEISTNDAVIKASQDINAIYVKIEKELDEAAVTYGSKLKKKIDDLSAKKKLDDDDKVSLENLKLQFSEIASFKVNKNSIRSANMNVVSNNMDDAGYDMLIGSIREVYGISEYEAKLLIGTLSNNSQAMFLKVPKRTVDGVVEEAYDISIVDMKKDLNKFKPFEYTDLDGNVITMKLNDLFEINPTLSTSTSAKDVAGRIALMDAGETPTSVMRSLNYMSKEGVPKSVTDAVKDGLTIIMGGTILDQSSQLSKLRRDATNFTIGATMGLSVLSQLPEALRFLFGKGNPLRNTADGVSAILGKYKYKGILKELIDDMGLAQDSKSLTFGAVDHIGDNNINVQTGRNSKVGDTVTKVGEIARDTSLYAMVKTSDLLTKLALMKNIEWLNEILNGKTLSPDRMKIFGLTEANMKAFKKHGLHRLQEGEKGTLGLDNWSREDRLEFYKVMQNMTMKDVQATTLGNSPQWQRKSELGMAISLLTKHSTMSVANNGIYAAKGAMNGDLFSVGRENFGMFLGGYVAAMLRDTLAGKEPNHAKYAVYAMLGLGVTQPFEVVKSLGDPAIFSNSRNIVDSIQAGMTPD